MVVMLDVIFFSFLEAAIVVSVGIFYHFSMYSGILCISNIGKEE